MNLNEIYSFEELTNEAERLVIEEMERQLSGPAQAHVAGDEGLVMDIAAYALNHVPPMYRANLLGRVYADTLRDRYGEAVQVAVRDAIRKVTGGSAT